MIRKNRNSSKYFTWILFPLKKDAINSQKEPIRICIIVTSVIKNNAIIIAGIIDTVCLVSLTGQTLIIIMNYINGNIFIRLKIELKIVLKQNKLSIDGP